MDITPAVPKERQVIERYGNGRFVISGRSFAGAVVVLPERTMSWAPDADDLSDAEVSLVPLLLEGEGVELVLIGCGARALPVPSKARQALRARGIAIEPMNTGAACRTYNVLMAEGRHVAAALLPVE